MSEWPRQFILSREDDLQTQLYSVPLGSDTPDGMVGYVCADLYADMVAERDGIQNELTMCELALNFSNEWLAQTSGELHELETWLLKIASLPDCKIREAVVDRAAEILAERDAREVPF